MQVPILKTWHSHLRLEEVHLHGSLLRRLTPSLRCVAKEFHSQSQFDHQKGPACVWFSQVKVHSTMAWEGNSCLGRFSRIRFCAQSTASRILGANGLYLVRLNVFWSTQLA